MPEPSRKASRLSRPPPPAGAMTASWPIVAASAYPDSAARVSEPVPLTPPTDRARTQVCSPNASHDATNRSTVTSTARPESSCSSGSRCSTRRPVATRTFSALGQQATTTRGSASSSQAALAAWEVPTSRARAGRPTSRPVSTPSPMLTSPTTPDRRRGTSSRAPISAWARTLHTDPGRYLPSCPTKKMPADGATCSGDPRSAISTRQPSIVSTGPTRARTSAATSAAGCTRDRSRDTSAQLRATAQATAARMTRATAMRSRPIRRRREGSTSAPPEGQAHERVGRVGPARPLAGAAHPRGDVAVEVADQDEADVVGTGQDAADLDRPDGALGRGRPERQGEGDQAAGAQRPGCLAEDLVDVVRVAAAGVQPGDDVERTGIDVQDSDRGPLPGQPELDRREADRARPPGQR